MKHPLYPICLLLFLGFSCTSSSTKDKPSKSIDIKATLVSRVTYFEYQGYSDTIVALFDGRVLVIDKSKQTKDSVKAIPNVMIREEKSGKSVLTDSDGRFSIGFFEGKFSFLVSKAGYQPIRILNWVSDPDQVSQIEIALEKGTELQHFTLPKWTK